MGQKKIPFQETREMECINFTEILMEIEVEMAEIILMVEEETKETKELAINVIDLDT